MVLIEKYRTALRDDTDVLIKAFVKGNIDDILDWIKENIPLGEMIASNIGEAVVGYFAIDWVDARFHRLSPVLLGMMEDGIEDLIAGIMPLGEMLRGMKIPLFAKR